MLDPDKIKQVLLNLLRNAVENTHEGGTIRVEVGREGEWAEVAVNNEGPPIPKDLLPSLFVPFATSTQKGSGLGLAIVYQIVNEHGGRIDVSSDQETGTTFTVRLPLAPREDRPGGPSSDGRREAPGAS